MKRLGRCCGLAAIGSIVGSGCANVDGRWVLQWKRPQQHEAAASADEPEVAVRPDTVTTVTEPAPADDAPAADSDDAVSDFLRRLHLQDQPGAEPAGDPAWADEPVAGGGSAGMSANTGVTITDPGREADLGLSPQEPVQVTQALAAPSQATEPPRVESVSIVTTPPGPEEPSETKTLSTNAPLDATAVAEELGVRKYVSALESALEDDPADLELQWLLSTMRLVIGEDDEAAVISDEIARGPADLLRDAVRFFADVRQLLVDPSYPADETLAALEAVRARLQERAELTIPVVALCTRVRTFGVYDEMPADQFRAYRANRTVVYTEVKNFVSNQLADGKYETLMAGRLELFTADGRPVWQHEEDSIKEVSKQRREDFFLAQLVTFPADLAPGDYVLKVMIQDLLGAKANEAHLELTIGRQQLSSASR